MMGNCSCGAVDHMDQVEKYPVGTKVMLRDYGIAEVEHHCDDGRAIFNVGSVGHTFHAADTWVIEVLESPKKLLWSDERIQSTCGYYQDNWLTMLMEDVVEMRDEYEARIAELTK